MTSASTVYSMAVAMAGENSPRWMPDALKAGGEGGWGRCRSGCK